MLDWTVELALEGSDDLVRRIEHHTQAPWDASVLAQDHGLVEDRAFSRHAPVGIVCGFELWRWTRAHCKPAPRER